MPEIPISQNGLIQHVNTAVPISGHSIRYYGDDGTADALGNFQHGFNSAVSAVAQFKKEFDETENRLSATEARNLFVKINGDLQDRMKKNPGSFSEFETWAKEADKLYAEQSKVFLDRMTEKFRKQFEADMQGMRIEAFNRRRDVGTQAAVSANYSRFQALFKEAAERDPQEAMQLLEQHKGVLISPQEYQTRKEIDLPRISQSAQMRREVEANQDGIIEKLEAHDGKGNYTHFTAVTPEFRRSMIAYAKAKDSARRKDENIEFLDMLVSGAPISRETVEASFEGRTSPEDLRQKAEQLQMIDRIQSAKERANEKKEKAALNSMLFDIVTMKPPAGEYERAQAQADWERKIDTRFGGNGNAVHRLKQELSEVFKASNPQTAKQSYKNSYIYQYAVSVLSGIKKDFYSLENEADRSWWNSDTEDSKEIVSSNYKMAQVALDDFIKNNPNATTADVESFLQNLKKDVNKTEVGKLIGFWTERRAAPQAGKTPITSGEVERSVNGRIAIFGNDHKFIRWKDGK